MTIRTGCIDMVIRGLLFTKQRFNVSRAVIDMEHLNALGNGAIKNQVVAEAGHAP